MAFLAIPLFVLGVAAIVAFWNSPAARRSGGRTGTAVGSALETLNAALGGGEHKAALEYRKEVHDERMRPEDPDPTTRRTGNAISRQGPGCHARSFLRQPSLMNCSIT